MYTDPNHACNLMISGVNTKFLCCLYQLLCWSQVQYHRHFCLNITCGRIV